MISEDVAAGLAAGAVGIGYAIKYITSKWSPDSDGERERKRATAMAQTALVRSLRDEIDRLNDLVGSLSVRVDEEIEARRRIQDENGRLSRKIFVLESEVRRLGGSID